jgi:hypothetical protein
MRRRTRYKERASRDDGWLRATRTATRIVIQSLPNAFPARSIPRCVGDKATGREHDGALSPIALLKRVPQVRILPGAHLSTRHFGL